MLKKVVGAALGARLAKNSPLAGGAAGAALATILPFVIARASLPSMVALGAAGYLLKRHRDLNKGGSGTYRASGAAANQPTT